MSDYPNLDWHGKTVKLLLAEIEDIHKWYGGFPVEGRKVRVKKQNKEYIVELAELTKILTPMASDIIPKLKITVPKNYTPYIGKKTKHEKKMEKKARRAKT